ncbi:hypothetical protein EI94DRAFT_1702943 [Lactarius quietus]|nr:hypothetical protein EI94DRAFT_1702943 [Lactarius quietus]
MTSGRYGRVVVVDANGGGLGSNGAIACTAELLVLFCEGGLVILCPLHQWNRRSMCENGWRWVVRRNERKGMGYSPSAQMVETTVVWDVCGTMLHCEESKKKLAGRWSLTQNIAIWMVKHDHQLVGQWSTTPEWLNSQMDNLKMSPACWMMVNNTEQQMTVEKKLEQVTDWLDDGPQHRLGGDEKKMNQNLNQNNHQLEGQQPTTQNGSTVGNSG